MVSILNYYLKGEGKLIIYLPGYLDDVNNFLKIYHYFPYRFLIIDYQKFDLKIEEISYEIQKIIEKENLTPLAMIGFSLGGKIAFDYALRYDFENLILIAPSLVNPKTLLTKLKIKSYKILKKFKLNKAHLFASLDYLLAPSKKLFIHYTNTYYDKYLKNYQGRCLLLYGKEDKVTPLKEARKIHKKIANSKLVINEETSHFLIYENPYFVRKSLQEFLND